jgi:hypothetical protein
VTVAISAQKTLEERVLVERVPWDLAVGLTYFPFGHKEVRMNAQALYMDRSAVGYTAVPYVVGGTGWVYTLDVGTWF